MGAQVFKTKAALSNRALMRGPFSGAKSKRPVSVTSSSGFSCTTANILPQNSACENNKQDLEFGKLKSGLPWVWVSVFHQPSLIPLQRVGHRRRLPQCSGGGWGRMEAAGGPTVVAAAMVDGIMIPIPKQDLFFNFPNWRP